MPIQAKTLNNVWGAKVFIHNGTAQDAEIFCAILISVIEIKERELRFSSDSKRLNTGLENIKKVQAIFDSERY